jgi:MFS family permease
MTSSDSDPNSTASTEIGYECPDPERAATASTTQPQLESQSPGGFSAAGHDPYAALRLPQYRLYGCGWMISVIGQQIQTVAVEWDIYNRVRATGGERQALLAMAYIGAVLAAPIILLAIPAGVLADRYDRRRLTQLGAALASLASLGLAGLSHWSGPLGLMYGVLGMGAIAQAVGWTARSALLPQIVPAESFSNAATWNSSMFQVAAMAGPALGGAIIIKSATLAYIVAAICSLAFFVFLIPVRVQTTARTREPLTLRSLAAGFRFVYRNKIILATITLDLFAVLFGGATALLPAYARDVLHVGSVGFGWLRAAPAVGALVMALWLAHRPPMQKAGRDMLFAVAGFGVATIIFGFSHWFVLSFLMLLLTGALDNISVVVRHTLVQMLTPDSMRGRVSAVNNVFIGASNELGAFESGLVGSRFGAVISVVSGGIGTLLVVAVVSIAWPQVRRFGSLSDARPEEEEVAPGFPVITAK